MFDVSNIQEPVVSQNFSRKFMWLNKKTERIAIMVLLFVVVVVAGIIIYKHFSSKKVILTTLQAQSAARTAINENNLTQAQTAINSGPVSQASLMESANIYQAEKNYPAALKALQTAQAKYGLTYSLAINIAQTEGLEGNTSSSISYYNQAIKLIQANESNIPNASSTITDLQTIVGELQQ